MAEPSERLAVLGQGYVGLILAARAVEAGYDVIGFDVDETRVGLLQAGRSYIEDVPSAQLAEMLGTGRFCASTDPASLDGFDVAVITVQTPLRDGVPDLSFISDAAALVGPRIRPGACVVLESTTYPGTTEEVLAPLLEAGSGLTAGRDFSLGYSPERIDPGNRTWTFAKTPKVVSGIDEASLARVEAFYGGLVERTVPVGGTREAELTKLLENTFRHVNIALVNELARYAAELGISVWEAIDAASTKPFGYLRFTPGPGVGGHCLPVDPTYLSWKVQRSLGSSFRFVELANAINDDMPAYVVQRLEAGLARRQRVLQGAHLLLVGLAFKADTADLREAPALHIARRLSAFGAAVHAADPHVLDPLPDAPLVRVELTPKEVERADAVVLVTDHSTFDLTIIERHAAYAFDTRHRLRAGPNVEYL